MHITGASTCIVVPSQPSMSNYSAAPDYDHTITINRASTTTVTCSAGPFHLQGLGDHASLGQRHRLWRAQPVAEGQSDPALVYGENRDLFRFTNGCFAFSRELANAWLRLSGLLSGPYHYTCGTGWPQKPPT